MIVNFDNNKDAVDLYQRMNKPLVDGYKRVGNMPNLLQHTENFEKTYNVKVVLGHSGFWAGLEFPTEQDYIWAMLKW